MKIVIAPDSIQYTGFVQSIPAQFDKSGTVIFKRRNEIRVFDVDGIALNVKRFKVPGLFNRMMYSFFRLSKAQRSYEYALRLIAKGINTPPPIAYILIKRNGLIHDSYYISHQVDYNRNMYEFGRGGISGREHILAELAIFTARMHESGVLHRDYSPGNILFKETDDAVEFCIVDINRLQFMKTPVSSGCANFARLWGQQPLFEFVAKRYAKERKADAALCIELVLKAKNAFWERYTRKHPLPF